MKMSDKELKDYQNQLKLLGAQAYPYATRQTIEDTAAHARRVALYNVRNSMAIRNTWTEGSIKSTKVGKVMDIDRQEASAGSYQEYMATQELGGIKRKTGSKGVPIPTAYSAGQSGKRTRLPRASNTLRKIKLNRTGNASSRAQQNVIAVKAAAESGSRYVYLDLGRRRGIFKVVGGKRKPAVKMLYDLSKPAVNIPKNAWLYPASLNAIKAQPDYFYKALVFQLKRHQLGSFRAS